MARGVLRVRETNVFGTLPAAPARRQVEMIPNDPPSVKCRSPFPQEWSHLPPMHSVLSFARRVILPATVLCLLNALKPLTVDDPAYYALARQVAHHPLDPYGFTIFWYQHPQPAHE